MSKTNPILIKKCRSLRRQDFSLNEIVKLTRLPKTTIYDNIRDIPLSEEAKERIKEKGRKRIIQVNIKRKGKCMFGRIVPKPKFWTHGLIFLTAHLMFDGEIKSHRCVYQNRNLVLINRVKNLVKDIFNLDPIYRFYDNTGVHRISYHYVELGNYFQHKSHQLKNYIKKASLGDKRLFLSAFFDDEGCVYKYRNNRKVRGYQHDLKILEIIQKLLRDFNIESKVDEKYKEIVISRKENLIKFRDKINFSKGVCINPERKNSIWKEKLEKREILNRAINSYKV